MPSAHTAPVFVVGASRSGTTLVYSALLASGAFPVYEAETRLLNLCPAKYGSLRREASFRRFLSDWLRSRQFARSGLGPAEFTRIAAAHRDSYVQLLEAFMTCVARQQGKRRWAEKTPGHLFAMPELARSFPDARFIHVLRDGRDVALSRRRLGWTGRSRSPRSQLLSAALQWEIAVRTGRAHGRRLEDRYAEVRYEDLVREPEGGFRQIADFACVPIDLGRLDASHLGALGSANTAFADPLKGVSRAAVGRWRRVLEPHEVELLETEVGETLRLLGYDVTAPLRPSLRGRLLRSWIRAKHFGRRRTPLGRLAPTDLEVGLS